MNTGNDGGSRVPPSSSLRASHRWIKVKRTLFLPFVKVRVLSGIHFAATPPPSALCMTFPLSLNLYLIILQRSGPRKRECDTPMDFSFVCGFFTFKSLWHIHRKHGAFPAIHIRCCLPGAQGCPMWSDAHSHWGTHVCSPSSLDPLWCVSDWNLEKCLVTFY